MGKQYIRFDEIEDVLTSVELIALTAPLLKASPSYWKWIIVGAQNGLQGAMVCFLAGTNGIGVLDIGENGPRLPSRSTGALASQKDLKSS
jgi:hypothetical protein